SIRSRGEGTMSVIVDDALAEANDARQAEETRAPKAGFDEAYGAPARGDPERAFGKACSRCGDDDGQVEKTCVGKQWLCTNCAYEEDERPKARNDRRPQSVPTDTGAGRAASDAYASKDVGASGSPVTANTRSHIRSPARGGPERATSAQWQQCSCAEIQAADVSRHFRECLRRAVYPKPSAPKPQPVEPQGPDRCRKGTPECTVDHTGMLGGYSECVTPKPQPVEQTKVVSVISLSVRPQSAKPAKVEAPNPDGICQQCGEFMGTDDGLDPTAICHACAHQLLEETQVALAAANAADEVHRKGCDIAMAALVQAEAENRCDVCAGEPLASGMTCMCGGTGKMSEAVSVVRKAWADALVERDVVLNLLIEYGGDRIDVWQQERRRLLAEYDAKKGGPK